MSPIFYYPYAVSWRVCSSEQCVSFSTVIEGLMSEKAYSAPEVGDTFSPDVRPTPFQAASVAASSGLASLLS